MYRRITLLVVCVLALGPILSASTPVIAQDSPGVDSGFPQDIIVDELAAGEVDLSATSPGALNLERLVLPAGASLGSRQVATVEMLYVEGGVLTIVDSFGLTAALPEGNGAHLRAGAIYEASNDSTDSVSILRLSLVAPIADVTSVGTPSAMPMATPVASGGPGDVDVSSLAEIALTDAPAAPVTLFLARTTWQAGVDSGQYTQNGQIGMIVEAGTLTIASPSGIDAQVNAGNLVVLPADQPLRTRNDGGGDAVALLFGVVPVGESAVSVVAPTPPAPLTPTPALEATPVVIMEATTAPAPAADTILYQADTSGGLAGWSGAGGWQTVSGLLVNDGSSGSPAFIGAPYQPTTLDYAVEVEMQWARDGRSFGVVARGGDGGGYWAGFLPDCENGRIQLHAAPIRGYCGENSRITGSDVRLDSEWHTYRLEVQGNFVRVYLDGDLLIETTDNRFLSAGQVGLWSSGAQVNVRRFTVTALGG